MHDDSDHDEQIDAYLKDMEALEMAEMDSWLANASRQELVSKIRELQDQLNGLNLQRQEALGPVHDLVYGKNAWPVQTFTAPFESVGQLVAEVKQLRSEKDINNQIDLFLSDYRPEVMAQVIMYRRDRLLGRITYGWPEKAIASYVANTFLAAYSGWLRPGWSSDEEYRYWAAVVEALPQGNFRSLEKLDQVQIDLCEKEEQEGYAAGRVGLSDCPYPRDTLKAAMWRQGRRRGSTAYLASPRPQAAVSSASDDKVFGNQ
jgi:hypothetical protein